MGLDVIYLTTKHTMIQTRKTMRLDYFYLLV